MDTVNNGNTNFTQDDIFDEISANDSCGACEPHKATADDDCLEAPARHRFYRMAVLTVIVMITAASFAVTCARYISPEVIASRAIESSFYIPRRNLYLDSLPTLSVVGTNEDISGDIIDAIPQITEAELYFYDPAVIPEGRRGIVAEDLSGDAFSINNETAYAPDPQALFNAAMPVSAITSNKEPKVLIVHTHGTESYTPEGDISYSDGDAMRSSDTEQNVVAVGEVLARTLEACGVPTVHCTVMHDEESYYNSYLRARSSISEYLEMYPSIEYVFDIHRDSIVRSDGKKIKPAAVIDGRAAAQLMFVIGTDAKGANHPEWEDNLNIALKLQSKLCDEYTNLMRPINLRNAGFNGELTKGSMIIEVGSCGNTLEEAKYSAELFGKAAAELIKSSGIR